MADFPAPAPDAPASSEPVIDVSVEEVSDTPKEVDPLRATKHKYKANGKDIEVDYDELLARASKAEGADQKFAEAKQVQRQLKELESKLGRLSKADENNFLEMVEMIGWEKAQNFANTLVKKQLEWEELSEQDQRALLRERELEEREARLQDFESNEARKRDETSRSAALEAVDKEISSVVQIADEAGLSVARSPKFVEDVVDVYLSYLEYVDREEAAGRDVNSPPPTPIEVARIVQQRYDELSGGYLKKLKGSDLKSMLSPEQLKELRESQIDDLYVMNPRDSGKQKTASDSINPFEEKSNTSSKGKPSEDWFKAMDKKLGVRR